MEIGKTGKYFKYAIGEIVLVVIGILIALSINNWNENRKQNLEEIKILKNIKIDFANVIAECEENNNYREDIINTTNQFYNIIQNKNHEYSKTELDSLLAILFINPTYNGQTGSLNILFNTGIINSIKNSKIKEHLLLWPQLVEDIKEDEIYSSNTLHIEFRPLLRKYISIYDVNKQLNFKIKLFNNTLNSSFNGDYIGLFNDLEFEGILASRELHLSVSLIQTKNLIKTAQQIIELINKELEL